jgi:polyisoprenoid-binding protein YceI
MSTVEPDAATSSITLFTYKEGLLSSVAHDLRFDATGWRAPLARDGDRVSVEVVVPVRGLRVRGQVTSGQVVALRDKDHAEIEGNLQGKHVLDAARHPDLRFTGQGTLPAGDGPVQVEGALTLAGQTRPLRLTASVRRDGADLRVEGEVRLRQTTWGVKPYSALLGALRVQDEVKVAWSLRYPSP